MTHHKTLRVTLEHFGIRNRQLARAAGLTEVKISRMLTGRTVHIERKTREKLAAGLRELITAENII